MIGEPTALYVDPNLACAKYSAIKCLPTMKSSEVIAAPSATSLHFNRTSGTIL